MTGVPSFPTETGKHLKLMSNILIPEIISDDNKMARLQSQDIAFIFLGFNPYHAEFLK